MKYTIYILAFAIGSVFVTNTSYAQQGGVSINSTSTPADSSAMLDIASTTKGLLPPRMTTAQKDLISGPATGLVVYQTDSTAGLYCNNGTPASPNWQLLAPAILLSYGSFHILTLSTLLAGGYQNVNFNTTTLANNVSFNSLNKNAVIATTGIYKISYSLYSILDPGQLQAQITLNGTSAGNDYIQTISVINTAFMELSNEGIFSLHAGDAVAIQAEAVSGTVIVNGGTLDIMQIQ
jgi:hypothetical protein